MYLYIEVWWAFWDLSAVTTSNQGFFTLVLLIPCI
jgi:hypothetical protein